MADVRFTKGPWFWDGDGLWQEGNGKPYRKAACVQRAIYEYDSGADINVSEPDARLIAAAPELYEALAACAEDLAEWVKNAYAGTLHYPLMAARMARDMETVTKARAALSKATGSKPSPNSTGE